MKAALIIIGVFSNFATNSFVVMMPDFDTCMTVGPFLAGAMQDRHQHDDPQSIDHFHVCVDAVKKDNARKEDA